MSKFSPRPSVRKSKVYSFVGSGVKYQQMGGFLYVHVLSPYHAQHLCHPNLFSHEPVHYMAGLPIYSVQFLVKSNCVDINKSGNSAFSRKQNYRFILNLDKSFSYFFVIKPPPALSNSCLSMNFIFLFYQANFTEVSPRIDFILKAA